MLLINITFFSVTICAIWRTDASIEEVNVKRNDSDSKRKTFLKSHQSKKTNDALIKKTLKTKSKVLLFTKLLILMGLGWMLSFMASFLDQKWIYLVDTIVNAFQGFFISLIFISFNKDWKSYD